MPVLGSRELPVLRGNQAAGCGVGVGVVEQIQGVVVFADFEFEVVAGSLVQNRDSGTVRSLAPEERNFGCSGVSFGELLLVPSRMRGG